MDKIIGENLRKVRKKQKVSQQSLAKFLGLHQTIICRIEKGERSLLASEAIQISDFLHVQIGQLISDKGRRT